MAKVLNMDIGLCLSILMFIQNKKQPFPSGLIEHSNILLAAPGVIEYSCLPMEIILSTLTTAESELLKVLLSIFGISVPLNHPKGQAHKQEKTLNAVV